MELFLPIRAAAEEGDLEEVMRLVQEDPGVVNTTTNDKKKAALHFACWNHPINPIHGCILASALSPK